MKRLMCLVISFLILGSYQAFAVSPTVIKMMAMTPELPELTNIHSITKASLLKQSNNNGVSTATLQLEGVFEGNTCGATDLALENLYIGREFTADTEISESEINLVPIKRTNILNLTGTACASFSEPKPFVATMSVWTPTNGIPLRKSTQKFKIATRGPGSPAAERWLILNWGPNVGWILELQ